MTELMKGVWISQKQITVRDDLPKPDIEDGDALIKPLLVGICGTDIQLTKGYYDFTGVPGHEFVGEVVEAPGNEKWVGQRVVGEINIGCGSCYYCEEGLENHCNDRHVLGIKQHPGALAEYFRLPIKNLHPVPPETNDIDAVYVEPLASVLHIREQTNIQKDTSILIIGAGKLGLLAAMALSKFTNNVNVVAHYQHQRDILQQLNIECIEHISKNTKQWDIVIDTSGSPSGLADALSAVRPLGSIVVKSTYSENIKVNFSQIVVDEVRIIGSRCGPFEPALSAIKDGLRPSKLTSEIVPFDKAEEAFRLAVKKGVTKIVVQF